MIALSLLHSPGLVIADEPTTALDVLVQDQILGEIDDLRRRMGLSLILISHDMGAVAETCERVAVMYAGEIVEIAPTDVIFEGASHPYTQALLAALPTVSGPRRDLVSIPGETASLVTPPAGCRFSPRCTRAQEACRSIPPPRTTLGPSHDVLCHFPGPEHVS
jgi:peptide/nickel transport system permease protein